MIKSLYVVLLLATTVQTVLAQNTGRVFTVKAFVADSLTMEPEPYATVRITEQADTGRLLKMALADKNGLLNERVSGEGMMRITVSSMGRKDVVRDFAAGDGDKVVDLGTILMTHADNELQQVVVTAQKPLVKADVDKVTYNIEDDPDSKSNNVLDMLRKVPMVTVDGEDNIKVNGKSSFKVYVNGKPNKMMSDNPSDVLKSMPANSIKSIEVITNPGPKYDAEGVGGILNIITTGGGMEGYTVTLRGDAGNRNAGGGLFGTVKSGNLTVSARYNYRRGVPLDFYSGGQQLTTGKVSESSSDISYENNVRYGTKTHNGSLEASYEIDTLRLVSAELSMWGMVSDRDAGGYTSAVRPDNKSELYSYRTLGSNRATRFSVNGGVDYQRTFANVKERMLTLSYRINTNPQTSDSYTDYSSMKGTDDWQDFLSLIKNQHTDGDQNITEHTVQIDYTTPLGKGHTLETGVKYIQRDNKSENDRWEQTVAESGEYEQDTEHSSHYKHRSLIAAVYGGYGLNINKWSARVGLRYEHTAQNVKYLLGRGEDFRKNFDDVVPSVSVGYKLTDMSNIRMGYNMRIYRPGIYYLNPYLDDSNPTRISQGNPELTSEKTNALNLSYSNFTQKFNINISAGYSFTDNSIEDITRLVSDMTLVDKGLQNATGKDVIYSTYGNIGTMRALDLSGYVSWNVTSKMRVYSNMYGRYSYLNNGCDLRNSGWFMSVYGGVQQTLPKDWRIGVNCYYQTPWIMLQGKGNKWLDYGVSINKSFMNKRLELSAYANNFFRKYYNSGWSEQNSGFVSRNWQRQPLQKFGMSVNFRIGELKAGVKKAERTINNDDAKSGGNNSN